MTARIKTSHSLLEVLRRYGHRYRTGILSCLVSAPDNLQPSGKPFAIRSVEVFPKALALGDQNDGSERWPVSTMRTQDY
jgi:hypothetical protein